jgi:SAM-dependent methyltransferase
MPKPQVLALSVALLIASAHGSAAPQQDQVEIHAPYVETSLTVADAMLKLGHAGRKDLVYDLGCGDGRIVIMAAKRYGSRGVGIDINPERIRQAKANARRDGVADLVTFQVGDVYNANLRNATVVMLYLLPDMNLKLRPKLKAELKPGARIVSHSFDMGDWNAKKQKVIGGERIYLWVLRRRFWFFL